MNSVSRRTCVFLCIGLLTIGAQTALADHIPGHDDCDPTFPAPIPGEDTFSGDGVVLFVTLIGPDAGTLITATTFDITFVSDGVMPASELELGVRLGVDGELVEVRVLGSDLGFGGGPGTFVGTLQTDAFNGIVDPGFPGPVINLQISRSNGDGVDGTAFFVDSAIVFDVVPPPPCDDPSGAVCGNGTIEGDEECDDGNTMPGDGCDARCNLEPGPGTICLCHTPPGNASAAHAICIGAAAVPAHLNHGDTLGSCAGVSTTAHAAMDLAQQPQVGSGASTPSPQRASGARDRLLDALKVETNPARALALLGRLIGRVDRAYDPLLIDHLERIRRNATKDQAHLRRQAEALLLRLKD